MSPTSPSPNDRRRRPSLGATALACALALMGCRHGPSLSTHTGKEEVVGWEDDLRTRAGFELNCDPKVLEVVDLGRGTAGVNGCGSRNVYKFTQLGWVANTAVQGGYP